MVFDPVFMTIFLRAQSEVPGYRDDAGSFGSGWCARRHPVCAHRDTRRLARCTTRVRAAFPGAVDDDGQPVTAGSTTVLSKAAAKPIVPLLRPTGATLERTFAWGSAAPTVVTVIEPFVVEVEADASAQTGVMRHSARLHRARPDLDPVEVT